MRDKIFNNLKEIQHEMLRILGEVSSLTQYPLSIDHHNMDNKWHPRLDMFAIDDKLFIILELSGIDKQSLNFSTSEEYIKINGTRPCAYQCKDVSFYNMEIESGEFERKIYLPDLELEKMEPKITYLNGFLKLEFQIKIKEEKTFHIIVE